DSEMTDVEREAADLMKEAEAIIEQICALLGISVENAKEAIINLMADGNLVSGESAEFLDNALSMGAKNVPLIKLQDLVTLLQKTADYLSESTAIDPADTLFAEVVEKAITEKQNGFKGLPEDVGKSDIPVEEFAKVVAKLCETVEKEANGGETLPEEPANALNGAESSTDDEAPEVTSLIGKLTAESETSADSKVENVENASESANAAANVPKEDTAKAEAEAKPVENEPTIAFSSEPLKNIGSRAPDLNSNNDAQQENKPVDAVKSDSGSSKNDILESMKVTVIESDKPFEVDSAATKDELIDNTKLATEVLKASEGGKIEPNNMNMSQGVMDVKGTPIMDKIEKIDVISQIMDKAKVTLKNGQNMIRVQLKPERLGEVFLRVSMEEGKVIAKVITETHMAKEALESGVYQLKEALSTQGIKIDKFNVFVGDKWQEQGGQSAFNQQSGTKNGGKGYKEQNDFDPYPTGSDLVTNAIMSGYGELEPGQLNFVA
ncbi:flagellar hook-length control protein FliK, partial [Thermodesulfobacteriota bacterium]